MQELQVCGEKKGSYMSKHFQIKNYNINKRIAPSLVEARCGLNNRNEGLK